MLTQKFKTKVKNMLDVKLGPTDFLQGIYNRIAFHMSS